MSEVNKKIRDGMVAVLYSPGYGAGWSTWAVNDLKERAMFCPEAVEWVEAGKPQPEPNWEELFGVEFYGGGARTLNICWLPVGTLFKIKEYDGSESIEVRDKPDWIVA